MKETKFKQSEVGMIPSDWKVKALNELCECNRSSTLSLPKEFVYVDLESVYQGKLLKKQIIKACDAPSRAQRFFEKGDILYQTVRPYQRNNLKVDFDAKNYIASTGYAVLHCKESLLNSDYLYQYIHTDRFVDVVMDNCSGTSYPAINPKTLMTFNIIIPSSFEEQQRIANALSDVDTLINNLEKLIAKKKNIKQGAMQQLLTGKKRLPGFGSDERTGSRPTDERRKECHSERSAKREVEESSGYKMTELGLIPSDWEVKTFGELFDMCTANIPIKDVNQEFYVGTENMLQNKMGVVKNTAVLPYSKVRKYQKNDILVSNIRPYLKKIWFADKNGGCSTDVLVFRVKDKNQSPSFLYNVVADDRFFNIVNENAIGTKMPRGDKNVIKQILFAVPSSKAEQTAIANVLSDMDTEISALETKLAKYRKLKTGMMQQLLTGKIRLV